MREYLLNLIKELCLIEGVSGDEARVTEYIAKQIKDCCEFKIDSLGNIIGKKGKGNNILIDAHTDEVGFIVKSITSNGELRLKAVGGIDPRILPDTAITVNNKNGIISCKPVHLMSAEEKSKPRPESELVADIGAENPEQAERIASVGDFVAFKRHFELFGENNDFIVSPALDDRVGCAILIALICKTDLSFDFSFSVQEEVGCRGAAASSAQSKAEYALAIETTTAADIDGVAKENRVCVLGNGAVVSFMDKSTVYDKEFYEKLFCKAKELDIKIQSKKAVAGGNNMGAIHKGGEGKRAAVVSVPARYLHSPAVVVRMSDVLSSLELIKAYIL